jgi:hypothetical protein
VVGVGDVTEGLAVFDHPHNPNHPNPVFTRAYGPTSPFQGHHFTGVTTMAAGAVQLVVCIIAVGFSGMRD